MGSGKSSERFRAAGASKTFEKNGAMDKFVLIFGKFNLISRAIPGKNRRKPASEGVSNTGAACTAGSSSGRADGHGWSVEWTGR